MKFTSETKLKTCRELLEEYEKGASAAGGAGKLVFGGVGARDVYNIAAPFEDEGEAVIAGRVERRDSEESEIVFFTEKDGVWTPREGSPLLKLQDPFRAVVGEELLIGGVETYPDPDHPGGLLWRTVLHRGSKIADLQPFFRGPERMKDLRLVQLDDGGIGVFTRPQGEKGGRGKIGFLRLDSLDELSVDAIENAPLLENQFDDEEWGGANEIHPLANGRLGVLGHIACFDERGDRHYYPMTFVFDPASGTHTAIVLLAVRADFLPGPSKRPDLRDVVFSGGLIRRPGGGALLYAGTGDAEAQALEVDDPFAAFER
ncbi:DUF1861 family protein [Saccharibacillus sp. CPCC 101409]|uniref:DUF1861 family protein n=1 Tax=Saccharibacillus sp. CPCC 101409 TaxID=3058041 RepID=UPI002671BDC8|nr:DUF1861 family protein [Saccharibacillus sp. CPCC 101409]MDO3411469.1 DUF1861 family protein [Saccharibacillus sp. CPCC 101409]